MGGAVVCGVGEGPGVDPPPMTSGGPMSMPPSPGEDCPPPISSAEASPKFGSGLGAMICCVDKYQMACLLDFLPQPTSPSYRIQTPTSVIGVPSGTRRRIRSNPTKSRRRPSDTRAWLTLGPRCNRHGGGLSRVKSPLTCSRRNKWSSGAACRSVNEIAKGSRLVRTGTEVAVGPGIGLKAPRLFAPQAARNPTSKHALSKVIQNRFTIYNCMVTDGLWSNLLAGN